MAPCPVTETIGRFYIFVSGRAARWDGLFARRLLDCVANLLIGVRLLAAQIMLSPVPSRKADRIMTRQND
jgi:hypothetical protein